MINPHQVLDYENWWNKSLNNIKPYRIPPLSNDIVTKLHNQLDASSDRIWRTRSAEEATKIIELLRELINSHTEAHIQIFMEPILVQEPAKKTKQGIPQKYSCCVAFISNYLQVPIIYFCFPTNRQGSILLKKWQ